jgi:hypothetical protein
MLMKIELNDEQQRAVQQGQPVEIVDPNTDRAYLVIARDAYERRRAFQDQPWPPAVSGEDTNRIPPGILRSQQAFWQDLPELLKTRRNHGKWVCYHGDQRIGIAGTKTELVRAMHQGRICRGEYYVAVIRPREIPPWEPEEIEPLGPHHFEG